MGRGLAALLKTSTICGAGYQHLRQVPVDLISPNPRQPRREFDEAALLALAGSLGERRALPPLLCRAPTGGGLSPGGWASAGCSSPCASGPRREAATS